MIILHKSIFISNISHMSLFIAKLTPSMFSWKFPSTRLENSQSTESFLKSYKWNLWIIFSVLIFIWSINSLFSLSKNSIIIIAINLKCISSIVHSYFHYKATTTIFPNFTYSSGSIFYIRVYTCQQYCCCTALTSQNLESFCFIFGENFLYCQRARLCTRKGITRDERGSKGEKCIDSFFPCVYLSTCTYFHHHSIISWRSSLPISLLLALRRPCSIFLMLPVIILIVLRSSLSVFFCHSIQPKPCWKMLPPLACRLVRSESRAGEQHPLGFFFVGGKPWTNSSHASRPSQHPPCFLWLTRFTCTTHQHSMHIPIPIDPKRSCSQAFLMFSDR